MLARSDTRQALLDHIIALEGVTLLPFFRRAAPKVEEKTEAALTRLYDFPIRRVELAREEGVFSTLVPVFS